MTPSDYQARQDGILDALSAYTPSSVRVMNASRWELVKARISKVWTVGVFLWLTGLLFWLVFHLASLTPTLGEGIFLAGACVLLGIPSSAFLVAVLKAWEIPQSSAMLWGRLTGWGVPLDEENAKILANILAYSKSLESIAVGWAVKLDRPLVMREFYILKRGYDALFALDLQRELDARTEAANQRIEDALNVHGFLDKVDASRQAQALEQNTPGSLTDEKPRRI